jgi:hypothetical protein
MKTLAELRSETAVWLDDPKKSRFDDTLLNTLLNMAYPMVVAAVEAAGRLWNLAGPIAVAVTPAAKEYDVGTVGSVRRIVDVRKVVGTSRVQVPFLVLTEVNRDGSTNYYPQLDNAPQTTGVSIFRNAGGQWRLRFGEDAPVTQTLEVHYIPAVNLLALDTDVPSMVPEGFHHVVAMQAAIIGKGSEERTNSTLEMRFNEQRSIMVGEAQSLVAHRSQRI